MTLIKSILRIVLILHGLLNIAQGLYGVLKPSDFVKASGRMFEGTPDVAVQSIGLGGIGVGTYGALGAYQNTRRFYVVTCALRTGFAVLVSSQMGSQSMSDVIAYEASVAAIAALAALI